VDQLVTKSEEWSRVVDRRAGDRARRLPL